MNCEAPRSTNHHCKMRKSTKIHYPGLRVNMYFVLGVSVLPHKEFCGVTVCSLLDRKNQLIHLSDVLRSNLGGKNLGFMLMKSRCDILL